MQIDTSTESLLSSILFHHSALVPVKNLSFPSNIPFDVAHTFFLKKILRSNHLRQYPPSVSYQQSFWKWVLVGLESLSHSNEDHEIDECIYAHYLSLGTGARSSSEAPSSSYITHYWKSPSPETHDDPMENPYETITLLESRTTIEAGTTGLRTWRASLVLAQYLLQHPHLVSANNVLELGSGTGFVGIIVACLQLHAANRHHGCDVPSVYLTDVNSTVLARCQNNVRLPCNKSSSHPNIHYSTLDWLDAQSDQDGLRTFLDETKADMMLGADIVFDPALIPPLVQTISLALSSGRIRSALIAVTVRNEDTLGSFLDEIGKVLKAEEVPHVITGNLPLQILDQVDEDLEVKIFRVILGSEGMPSPV